MSSRQKKIAILCANGLGDALIQMVLANNLARQGLAVTFYSNFGAQLNELVKSYQLMPFPSYEDLSALIDDHDLLLYNSSGKYVREIPTELESWCQQNAVCFRMSDAPPRHQSVSEQTVAKRIGKDCPMNAYQFKQLNASLRGCYKTSYRPPVIKQLTDYLNDIIKLNSVTLANGLEVDRSNTCVNQVLIHPTSSKPNKNWTEAKFITLIERIIRLGYTPVVTVAPNEHNYWVTRVAQRCEVLAFAELTELARYYSGANLFIGNDSGAGHLASCLGIPTIQLFSGWKRYPAWRAGWSDNLVITADLPFNLIKKKWQRGVSVNKVITAIQHYEETGVIKKV